MESGLCTSAVSDVCTHTWWPGGGDGGAGGDLELREHVVHVGVAGLVSAHREQQLPHLGPLPQSPVLHCDLRSLRRRAPPWCTPPRPGAPRPGAPMAAAPRPPLTVGWAECGAC